MKKLLLLFIVMISLVGTISGLEIDNTKTFDEKDRSLVVHNAFNLPLIGSDIAKITPLTPHVVSVIRGENRRVAEFEIENYADDYVNVWKDMEFYNLKNNGEEETRKFFFKYELIIGTKEKPITEIVCENLISKNGTSYQDCNDIIKGYETVNITEWRNLDVSQPLPKGTYNIKIITDVFPNEHMEFIPTWFGVRMPEYSVWTESLNVDLVSYYKFDGTSGDVGDSLEKHNLTNTGATRGSTGIIGNSFTFAINDLVSGSFSETFENLTVSAWYKSGAEMANFGGIIRMDTNEFYLRKNGVNNDIMVVVNTGAGDIFIQPNENSLDGNWHFVVAIWSNVDDTVRLWVDNVDLGTGTGTSGSLAVTTLEFGEGAGGEDWGGDVDETGIWSRSLTGAEITQLYNGGAGISFTTFGPTVTLNSPVDAFNTTNQTINFNGSAVSDIGVTNVTLFIDGVLNETNSSGINDTDYLFTKITSDGNHNWTYESCDSSECTTATTRTFTIDTILPIIDISYPVNGQNFLYLTNLNNITLNTTITDTNLDTCWYEYNSTNTTLSCSSGVLSENNLTINNESVVIVWANDSTGQENSSTSDWTYDLFDFNDYTFDVTMTESSSTTFIGNFQTGTAITSVFLEYNNTNYSVSTNSLGGNRYTLTSTLTTPKIESSDTNITWFFWVNGINATSRNQTVQSINLDDCSSYTNYIVNYTLVDELTQVEISNANSSIESLITLQTLGGNEVATFNQTFTGDSTPTVCSEIQLNETGLRFWEQSRYGSDDYVFEQHNIQNASMTSLPAEITLRDLPSNSATTFRITYKSETFLAVPDTVINIQRKYIGEGVFKSIESPITDANGEVSASLDLDAVIYRIVVSKDGTTLSTFENPAVACQNILTGDCTININERQTVNLINNYDVINDFNFGLTQDNRTITLTFEIPSGESKLVNLFVNQSTILGNKTSCNQTLLATSGQIQCVISDTLGDVFTNIRVSSDSVLITTASTTILEDRSQYFGTDNIVLTFFLVLSLVLLFISDPIAVLIGIIIGLISSSLMLFLNAGSVFGTTSVLMYLIVIVIIITIKVSVRQQR